MKFFVKNIILKVSGTVGGFFCTIPIDQNGALDPEDDPVAHKLYNILRRLV